MMSPPQPPIRVALACGGTGGHLYPGLAVAECLLDHGCEVTLLVSPKDVDQKAVTKLKRMHVVTLPAIGLTRGRRLAFARAFWRSCLASGKSFRSRPPHAVLAMGGFTAAPPLLAGKRLGAATFLHESNTIPGRANRWLARMVDGAFVGFPSAAARLRSRKVAHTGTPVRRCFQERDAASCRRALDLDPDRPVVLVMGGSQGAHGVNELVIRNLPDLAALGPDWQWLHLTGPAEVTTVQNAYAAARLRAIVHPFFGDMELALGAATVAISRAGASSLAELAAVRLPAVLVPYPAATDNHQFHNARAFVETGAASMLAQDAATPTALAQQLGPLVRDRGLREKMQAALAQWHRPDAAQRIAASMLQLLGVAIGESGTAPTGALGEPSAGVSDRRESPAGSPPNGDALTLLAPAPTTSTF